MRPASRRLHAVAGSMLLAGGLVALVLGATGRGTPTPRVLAPDRPVNVGAEDLGDISAHNSPNLVRNPRRPAELAVSSRIDTPDYSCALHLSRDGGRRWYPVRVPLPRGFGRKCYAPDVAFGADGTLHFSFVTLEGVGNVPSAVWIARSTDGGRTLSSPVRVSGPRAFQVRVTSDPGDARRVYVTWVQAAEVGSLRFTRPGNPVVVATSRDGGSTWSAPVRASDPRRRRVLAPAPAVGPQGDLYVLHLDVGEDRLDYEGGHDALGGPPYTGRFTLVLSRSMDGGRSWQQSVVDDGVVPVSRFVAFLPPFPSLAVDARNRTLHAAFHDGRYGSPDVHVWSLEPGAAGWRGPVRVDSSRAAARTAQLLPRLAVAPGGRVDVVYYDRRGDPTGRRTQVSLQSSSDGARSFGPPAELASRSFDAGIGAGSERGLPDLGSRIGLVSDDAGAFAVWTDTRSGTEASNKQDLRATPAAVEPGAGSPEGWLGLVMLAAGALVIVLPRRSRSNS